MEKISDRILFNLFLNSGLTITEQKEFYKIAKPIIHHKEFVKRCNSEFPHHGSTSLGEHIIKDAIKTYVLAKEYNKTHFLKKANIKISVIIALFHDLYTNPWQNSNEKTSVFNPDTHGMTHPIEAVLNSYKWFPKYFKNKKEAEIIIDGIIHHMYPYPVRKVENKNIKISNQKLLNKFKYYDYLIQTTKNKTKLKIDIKSPRSIEGKLLVKADKLISLSELNNFNSIKALVNGKNKNLTRNME